MRAGQEVDPQLLSEGRKERWPRFRLALEILPLHSGAEGRLDSAAPVVREPEEHQWRPLQQQSQLQSVRRQQSESV